MRFQNTRRRFYALMRWKRIGAAAIAAARASKKVGTFVPQMVKYEEPKNETTGIVTTGQYDTKVQYRKRRMPKYKKRRWRKFVKKVTAVQKRSLGTRTLLRNSQLTTITDAGKPQAFLSAFLYGSRGIADNSDGCGNQDLNQIVAAELSTLPNNLKFTVYSAILDITLTNVSGVIQDTTFTPSLEVDIYHVKFYKEAQFQDFGALHVSARNNDAQLPNTSSAATSRVWLETRGATLFDMPILIQKSGMKIWKKTKVFLPPGAQATYQIRNPRNFEFSAQDIREVTTLNSFIYPARTEGVIVVFKPVTNLNGPAGVFAQTTRLAMGVTRKYNYVVDTDAVTRSAIV